MSLKEPHMYPFQRLRLSGRQQESPTLLSQAMQKSKRRDSLINFRKGSISTEDSYFNKLSEAVSTKATPKISAVKFPDEVDNILHEHPEDSDCDSDKEVNLASAPMEKPSIDGQNRETIYRETLRVVIDRQTTTAGGMNISKAVMYGYLQRALDVSDEDHRSHLTKEMAIQRPDKLLHVKVLEARNLEAKDEDGLSDPYCMLGVVHLSGDQQAHRQKGARMGQVEDVASETAKTAVRSDTLNPVWNEDFLLLVDKLDDHFLQVDVWDYDEHLSTTEALSRAKSIKGTKGFGRWMKKVSETFSRQSDDFMGRIFIPLRSITDRPQTNWFDLESKRKESVEGDIQLEFNFVTGKLAPVDASWQPVNIYRTLYWEFVRHRAMEMQEENQGVWDGELSNCAELILDMFGRHHELTALQKAAAEFAVLSEQHRRHFVSHKCLYEAAERVQNAWDVAKKTRVGLSEGELDLLMGCMSSSAKHCLRHITRLHFSFPTKQHSSLPRLNAMLGFLQVLESFKAFREHHPSMELEKEISVAVQEAARSHFNRQSAMLETGENDLPLVAERLTKLTNLVKEELANGQKFYSKVFKSVGVDYIENAMKIYDELLSTKLRTSIEDIHTKVSSWKEVPENGPQVGFSTFQVVIATQQLVNSIESNQECSRMDLQIRSFQEWFRQMDPFWLEMGEFKALTMIQKAVELDQAVRVTEDVKYSTSAVDAATTIDQVLEFWHQLRKLNPKDNAFLIPRIVSIIVLVTKHYGEAMLNKLKDKSFFSREGGEFYVSEELVVILNSLDYVHDQMRKVKEDLKLEEAFEGQPQEELERATTIVDTQMQSVDVEMFHQLNIILQNIIKQMYGDLHGYVKSTLDKLASTESVEMSLDRLMVYLAANLHTLCRELLHSTFLLIIRELWSSVLEMFAKLIDYNKCLNKTFLSRLDTAIEMMKRFFYSEGHGLSEEDLHPPALKDLKAELSMYSASSVEVVRRYFAELLKQQQAFTGSDSVDVGTVTVSIAYVRDADSLHLRVLHAADLPSMDTGGGCDPYIIVTLMPAQAFPRAKQAKTETVKASLTPLFDQLFEFSAPLSEIEKPGSVAVLHCMDWDRITADDFIGEAVVDLASAPTVTSASEAKDQSKTTTIKLRRPTGPAKIKAFDVLVSRDDAVAKAFVKSRTNLFEEAKEKVG